jgi:hypothetical protein
LLILKVSADYPSALYTVEDEVLTHPLQYFGVIQLTQISYTNIFQDNASSPRLTSFSVLILSIVLVLPSASIVSEKVPSCKPSNQKSPNPSVVAVTVPSAPVRVQVAPITTSSTAGSYTSPAINLWAG